jgi:hypothetical protein
MTNTLFIRFDDAVVCVETNVAPIYRFVRAAYANMLSAPSLNADANLAIAADGKKFEMRYQTTSSFELDSADQLIPLLKEKIIEIFMCLRPQLLWLHAGAAEKNGEAVMIAGPSGSGKSTLVTHLSGQGWRLLSDDVSPVRTDALQIIPFPQTPSRRIFPGKVVERSELGAVNRETVTLTEAQVADAPCRIAAVVFPQFDAESGSRMSPMSPGEGALELLKYVRNFGDHLGGAVEHAATLARNVRMFRLCYGSGEGAMADILNVL